VNKCDFLSPVDSGLDPACVVTADRRPYSAIWTTGEQAASYQGAGRPRPAEEKHQPKVYYVT
jgi:hypothetical protein